MSNSDGFKRKKNRKIFKKRTHTHTHTLPSSLPRISTCVSCPWSFALPVLRSQRRSASPQTLQRPLKCARCPALGTRSPRCTRPSGRAGRCPEREREREGSDRGGSVDQSSHRELGVLIQPDIYLVEPSTIFFSSSSSFPLVYSFLPWPLLPPTCILASSLASSFGIELIAEAYCAALTYSPPLSWQRRTSRAAEAS